MDISNKRFSIIGGDLRQVKIAKGFAKYGARVKAFGLEGFEVDESIIFARDLQSAIEDTDIVVAPLPCTTDDETVNAPFYKQKILFNDLFKDMCKNQIFLGGKITDKIEKMARVYGILPIDYYNREELVVLNSIPTAEGAIQIAMEEMPVTLHKSRCLILGYGRIGKVLANMLKGIGANVTVEARRYSDLAWIKTYGYKGVHLNRLNEVIDRFDVIFNTVPSMVLHKELLLKIKKDCLVIDLASKPGGVDFEIAKGAGVKTIWALSLPGKVAPNTAGEIIKDTILNIIEELGV